MFCSAVCFLLFTSLSRGLQQLPLFYVVYIPFCFSILSKNPLYILSSKCCVHGEYPLGLFGFILCSGRGRGYSVSWGSLLTNLLQSFINQNFYSSFIGVIYCSHYLVCFQITKFVQDRHRARRNRLRKDQLKKLPVHKFKKGKWIILCLTHWTSLFLTPRTLQIKGVLSLRSNFEYT